MCIIYDMERISCFVPCCYGSAAGYMIDDLLRFLHSVLVYILLIQGRLYYCSEVDKRGKILSLYRA